MKNKVLIFMLAVVAVAIFYLTKKKVTTSVPASNTTTTTTSQPAANSVLALPISQAVNNLIDLAIPDTYIAPASPPPVGVGDTITTYMPDYTEITYY